MIKSFQPILIIFLFAMSAFSAVYEVGPGRPLTAIAQVPWATLQPGDHVKIYWRATPYREKWVICRQGTQTQPITVSGVANSKGQRPIVDGNGAVTPLNLNFASEQRGVIKIGSANVPADTMPRYIVIEGLEIKSGHPNYQFIDDNGNTQTYTTAASSIYLEKGENITLRNNIMHDSGNGLFVASSNDAVSKDILVDGNYIYGNGVVGSAFYHNNYTAALRITFQNNRFGPLRSGANGNNLKDRSAGTVIRYNWIDGGNRNLDLVDAEDSSQIRLAPEYGKTFVYGNVLLKSDGGNNQTTHYGGDSGATANYRKGMMYFYNNTIVSTRSGNTVILRLSTNDDKADVRNNVFYTQSAGTSLAMLAESGTLNVANNWSKSGWRNSFEGGFNGSVIGGSSFITGTSPGFVNIGDQNFKPDIASQLINAGIGLHADALPDNDLFYQYVKHQRVESRLVNGQIDIGAFEFSAFLPPVINSQNIPKATVKRRYAHRLNISGGTGALSFAVVSGTMPPGIYLDDSTGTFLGRVRIKGEWTFTVRVSDSLGLSTTQDITISSELYNF